jgi:hypothetical protein
MDTIRVITAAQRMAGFIFSAFIYPNLSKKKVLVMPFNEVRARLEFLL